MPPNSQEKIEACLVQKSGKYYSALYFSWIDTLRGLMLIIADDESLYLLEFIGRRGLDREIERLQKSQQVIFISGETTITKQISIEVQEYFSGTRRTFSAPITVIGSEFQKSVWLELQKIPMGETRSYADIAKALNKPTAYRAVANANAANQLAILIPCHRVINTNGDLGGYGGGIHHKQWLLNHEAEIA